MGEGASARRRLGLVGDFYYRYSPRRPFLLPVLPVVRCRGNYPIYNYVPEVTTERAAE